MPTISVFFGIVIRMYYDDHAPPHFHAHYGEQDALVRIDTLELIQGALPRRALAMVLEWAAIHRGELQADWQRAAAHQALDRIDPLE
ncbi:MAG: DUF4160 domain-containing protein [Deltaproteobacteria bacterium]|nr:DUF4160 domain-containing protein [Deltaproteobacteria bacterium]